MLPAPAVESFRPFVPAKDFETSKRFYQHIGFSVDLVFADGSGAILSLQKNTFILQNFYVKELAENYMMQMAVQDLDHWWRHLQAARLPENFAVAAPRAPKLQPWGLVVCYFFDPSGVLWHIVSAAG